MTDSGSGSSIPLKGILKKSGLSSDTEPLIHNPDCPMSCQSSRSLAHLQGHLSPNIPLKGILKTSCDPEGKQKDNNSSKCRKRQRWDEGNILATSCHSWLELKPRPHLCSVTTLDGAAGSSTSGGQACPCKRKKTQSWDETSILATQHPVRMDNSLTTADDGFPATVAWQSLSLKDDAGTSHSFTSQNEAMISQLVQEQNSLQSQTPVSNRNQTGNQLDQEQHIDITPERTDQSQPDTEKPKYKQKSTAKIQAKIKVSTQVQNTLFTEGPSFQELRKVHFRESRQVLLARRFLAKDSDEEEDEDMDDTADYPLPTLSNCSNCNCPSGVGSKLRS